MEKLISVIILNWNGADYLSDCLDSVLAQDYHPLEIIVVDNGSTDSSVELVRAKYESVRLIQNGSNLGFAAGNNVGIREANGEYLVILNNDAELDSKCLSEMKHAIDRDPKFGCCASKIYLKFEENLLDAVGIAICADGLSIGRGRLESGDLYNEEEEVFFGSGCCMMCRREMLEDVKVRDQYFDEDFFMYAEDTDLGWRARLRGWKAIYTPKAKVYHLHSAAAGSYSPAKAFLVERNRIWIQTKSFAPLMVLYGQFYTVLRYLFQAFGAVSGRGASGSFSKEHSRTALIIILFRVWYSALVSLLYTWKKRRIVQKSRTISAEEMWSLAKAYGISAREIATKG
jgi:GT2 family glycosyltransferase